MTVSKIGESLLKGSAEALVCKNKNTADTNEIKLIPAALDDLPIICNLARFYAYDLSEYFGDDPGWEMESDGLYGIGVDYKKYFKTEKAFPFLIRYKGELAGFAIVDQIGSEISINFNMAQFFVLRTYKRKGIGRHVARQCFNTFRGIWEIMVMPGNEGGCCFWKSIVKDYCNNNFTEYTRRVVHFNNELRDFFSFDNSTTCL